MNLEVANKSGVELDGHQAMLLAQHLFQRETLLQPRLANFTAMLHCLTGGAAFTVSSLKILVTAGACARTTLTRRLKELSVCGFLQCVKRGHYSWKKITPQVRELISKRTSSDKLIARGLFDPLAAPADHAEHIVKQMKLLNPNQRIAVMQQLARAIRIDEEARHADAVIRHRRSKIRPA